MTLTDLVSAQIKRLRGGSLTRSDSSPSSVIEKREIRLAVRASSVHCRW